MLGPMSTSGIRDVRCGRLREGGELCRRILARWWLNPNDPNLVEVDWAHGKTEVPGEEARSAAATGSSRFLPWPIGDVPDRWEFFCHPRRCQARYVLKHGTMLRLLHEADQRGETEIVLG